MTAKQTEAWRLLSGPANAVLLDGGARSGKSFVLCTSLIDRAQTFAGSRHLIARYRLAHAKSSIWHETLFPLLREAPGWLVHPGEPYAEFENGSEIWIGGFDDPERIEKILGHEYATIYENEISQISYEAHLMARSRLSQKIDGCINKVYCDCNPPSPQHWAHKIWFEGIEPRQRTPITDRSHYARMQMNPIDNLPNLPPNYVPDILGQLPDAERKRFLHGLWLKPERMAFYNFDDSMIVDEGKEPPIKDFEEFTWGIDFGLNPAAVLIGWMGDSIWFLDDWTAYNVTASAMNAVLDERWSKYKPHNVSYCDPSGGERIQEITAGDKADNSVEDGINYLNTKMERGHFHISRRCSGWLGELYDYHRNEKGLIVKMLDHHMDAGRYGSFSRAVTSGVVLYV
jgi:phage terminase large subunit